MRTIRKIFSFVLLQRELGTQRQNFDLAAQYQEVMGMLFRDLDLCCMMLPEFSCPQGNVNTAPSPFIIPLLPVGAG